MEVKICGLTKETEAEYLSDGNLKADYAGFVFYEKSKRYVTYDKAIQIKNRLHDIKAVAVTVSPDADMVRKICDCGFDVLQVHKNLTKEVLETTAIPVWYAFNIADSVELEKNIVFLNELPKPLSDKIKGIVVDSAKFGSGQTFDWSKDIKEKIRDILKNRKFILAGGLNTENLSSGIEIFEPDVVDVSSGVENETGKDKELVRNFIKIAKQGE